MKSIISASLLSAILAFSTLPAQAQQNCPATPAAGTSNTTCANTAFVQKQLAANGYVVGPASSTNGDVALFSGTSGLLIKDGGSFSSLLTSSLNAVLSPFMRSYIAGLTLSNDSVTPNSILDMAAGIAVDSTNAALMNLGTFTKSTAGAWASGSGSNGMGNGLTIANTTWYHVILANNGGTPDIYFDTSPTGANRPTGITDPLVRRIGSFLTDASAHIITFVQLGDTFLWKTGNVDFNGSISTTGSRTLKTLRVPSGVQVEALFNVQISAGSGVVNLAITSPDESDQAGGTYVSLTQPASGDAAAAEFRKRTDTSSEIGVRPSATATIYIYTYGWVDTRGRFN